MQLISLPNFLFCEKKHKVIPKENNMKSKNSLFLLSALVVMALGLLKVLVLDGDES